jgi:type I restriction enzyme S subunit
MTNSNMPVGWHQTTLGNIAVWGSGGTPSRKHPEFYGGDVPWVKTGDLGPKVLYNASEYITDLGVKKSSAKYFPKGSVAIAMYGATIGKTSILGFDTTTNQACAVGQPFNDITEATFLYYLLQNEKDAFIAKGKGGAQPNISQTLIKAHAVALPPLAEQQVIAAKLDTLLAQVDNTQARLERIPQILKRFRQSVLAAAVSGRLTEVSCEKLGTLKSITNIVSGLAFKKAQYSKSGSKLLQIANVGYSETKWDSVSYIPHSLANEFSAYTLQEGDLVMALNRPITNDTLKVASICANDLPATLYQRVARIRATSELLVSQYLFLLMQSPGFRKNVEQNLKGSDQPYLNTSSLGTFEINAPNLEEQTEIVRRVEQLFAYAEGVEQQVNNALERVNNLTQSILAKAFRGELTAQWREEHPELISAENSAAALLERIKAERAAMKTAKKPRQRGRKS